MSLKLNISTEKKKIFCKKIRNVMLKGQEGNLSIYINHAPLITLLKPGIIKINYKNFKYKNFYIYLSKGIAEVYKNIINIFVEYTIDSYDKFFKKKIFFKKKKIKKNKIYFKKKKFNIQYLKVIKKIEIFNILKKLNK